MTDTAVCIPFFSRVNKLENLLESIDDKISQIYIADNGQMTPDKEALYNREWPFGITVFDLEYDSGVGNCRRQLVEQTSEDVLFFIDPDMTMPHNYQILIDQLIAREDLGGVSGLLLEEARIFTSAADIEIRDDTVYIDHLQAKMVNTIAGSHFVTFDFIPQVGAFKRECVKQYTWDEFYRTQREHIDFFLAHKRRTNWQFGITPEVIFPHFPGGSDSYKSHRYSNTKHRESKAHFQQKFNCNGLKNQSRPWIDTYPHYERQSKMKALLNSWKNNGWKATVLIIIDHLRSFMRH